MKNFEEFVEYVESTEYNVARIKHDPNGKFYSRTDLQRQFDEGTKRARPVFYLDQGYKEPEIMIDENGKEHHLKGGPTIVIKCAWFEGDGSILERVDKTDDGIKFRTMSGEEFIQ